MASASATFDRAGRSRLQLIVSPSFARGFPAAAAAWLARFLIRERYFCHALGAGSPRIWRSSVELRSATCSSGCTRSKSVTL